MASVIVVENDIKDSVKEYGQIIDSIHQNTEFSDSLKPFFNEQTDEITNKSELASKLFGASKASTLTRLSDKELEPAFYLLTYLLNQLEETSFEKLLQKDSPLLQLLIESIPAQQPSLRDRRSLKPTTMLSIVNTLFNFLPQTSASRIYLVELTLKIVSDTHIDFALIQSSVGDNLVGWLKAAHASDAEIKRLFWFFVKLDKAHSLKSLHLIKTFTSEFTVSLAELHDLIPFALASTVVDVSFLVNNNVAQALQQNASDDLVATFVKYTRGELITAVPALLEADVVLPKSKILTLTRFFVENDTASKNLFKYSEIPAELVSSPADFEKLLVDSIKAGVIEGKLNQVDETFYLVRVNRFVLAGDNQKLAQGWDTVRSALLEWKESLENINEIVRNAKENIVNNNNAN